jgi:hypothetical protein
MSVLEHIIGDVTDVRQRGGVVTIEPRDADADNRIVITEPQSICGNDMRITLLQFFPEVPYIDQTIRHLVLKDRSHYICDAKHRSLLVGPLSSFDPDTILEVRREESRAIPNVLVLPAGLPRLPTLKGWSSVHFYAPVSGALPLETPQWIVELMKEKWDRLSGSS